MAIYITGDTHIPINVHKLNTKNFPEQKNLTKQDYVIICGDFGGVWDNSAEEQYWLKWLDSKNFTTLFIDGNHENFKLLNAYPTETFCGGKVHKILPSVLHLMRGEIFEIDNRKFFTMGGASSHDMHLRTEGKNWWKEELPSDEEYDNALRNLKKHDYTVDCIISHCCADSIFTKMAEYEKDRLTNFFEHIIKADCNYKKWFFAHYHVDAEIDEKHICLYNSFIRIKK
jgi:predicted phosphodiesterase